MARTGRYYFSRLVKGGVLDKEGVQAAILDAVSIQSNRYAWTIVHSQAMESVTYNKKEHRFIGGALSKYDPEAVVSVVDESTRRVVLRKEPNMELASSQFVYFPDHEVFVHRLIWDKISDQDFQRRISQLIKAFHGEFFVDCELHTVSDYTRFVGKLAELDSVTELSASVHPPNPLFSPFWDELKEYLKKRRLRRLSLSEVSNRGDSVATEAPEIAKRLASDAGLPKAPAMIGDAALLMAADGYGLAEVSGQRRGREVIVSTRDNALRVKIATTASYAEIANMGIREIVRIERQRKLQH